MMPNMLKKWRKSKLVIDHEIYRNQCAILNTLLRKSKAQFYSDKVETCSRDQKRIFKLTKHLLGEDNCTVLPTSKSSKELAQEFRDFFIGKVDTIRADIIASHTPFELQDLNKDMGHLSSDKCLVEFDPCSQEEIERIIRSSPNKSCELDLIPTWLLKDCLN